MELTEFHELFLAILGWSGNLDYIFRIHAQEFDSFRRITRSKTLREFQQHRQEKFLYICDTLDTWEWEIRVLNIHDGTAGDHIPSAWVAAGPPRRSFAAVRADLDWC